MLRDSRRFGAIFLCVALGCAAKPVTAPRVVVPEPVPAEVRAAATMGKRFGDMVAMGIGVANGSGKDVVISAERVFAIDRNGNRIAPLSVSESARQAGGATALVAGLKGAGASALLAGLVGAIPGAAIGAVQGGGSGAAEGAAIGAAIGATVGAVGGFFTTKSATEQQIIAQLGELYLGEQTAQPNTPVSGFVFFPRGEYIGARVLAVEKPTGAVQDIFGPLVTPAD